MRHIALVSVLLVGVASVASAQNNYVPAQNYNNPGVVVNMDVLQGGYGQRPNYPAPVLQQPLPPLRPPVLRQAAPAPRLAPAMPAPMASAPAMPAPIQQAAPALPPPVMAASPKPAPSLEVPKTVPPVAYRQEEPMKIAPYSTRALAAAAPPVAPPPSEAALKAPAVEDMPAPVPTPAPKQAAVNWDKAPAPAAKKTAAKTEAKRDEEPSITANSEADLNKDQKQARQLLAQAREEADQGPEAERKVVLFDDVPPAPKTDVKTASVAKASPPAMPAPIAPVVSNTDTLKPAALAAVAPASIPAGDAAKKAETQIDDFKAYRLMFDAQSANLKPTEREILDNVAAKLKGDENVRLQLRAYANGTPDTTAQARRLSLSRALAVRSYLVEQGITASRLDVRALGSGSAVMGDSVADASAPADRVDMVLVR